MVQSVFRDRFVEDLFPVVCGSMLVDVGRGESLAAGVGPAEGGEASPPSFAKDFYTIVYAWVAKQC